MTFNVRCFVEFGIACNADLPAGRSASNGKSSAAPGLAPAGLFADVPLPGAVGLEAAVAPGLEGVAPGLALDAAAGLGAAGLAPGLAVIDDPQNGQSSTSSSMTD